MPSKLEYNFMHSIQQYQEFIATYLQAQHRDKEPKNLYDPIHYILGLGGKRMRPVLTLMTLKSISDKLPARDFLRVHRSFIVPIHKIEKFSKAFER